MAEQPTLSIVVAATGGPSATRRVLADLAIQRGVPPAEVIVVDGVGTLLPDDLAASGPGGAELHGARGGRLRVAGPPGRAPRALYGDLLAFTEDLCRIPPDWCHVLLKTYEAGHRAFGWADRQRITPYSG